jgi:uncharacterized YigZ family protein
VYVPKTSHHIQQRIKNSRFIATAEPFGEPRTVKTRIAEVRRAHPGCAHVVYAFSVGGEKTRSFGMSDDGEPKGTAGRPVLDVLWGSEITDCLVTVVRFFGGTKLGTGGLVRAYGGAAREVLAELPTMPLVATVEFAVTVSYGSYEPVRRILAEFRANITSEEFGEAVRVAGTLPSSNVRGCSEALREATSGSVELL